MNEMPAWVRCLLIAVRRAMLVVCSEIEQVTRLKGHPEKKPDV